MPQAWIDPSTTLMTEEGDYDYTQCHTSMTHPHLSKGDLGPTSMFVLQTPTALSQNTAIKPLQYKLKYQSLATLFNMPRRRSDTINQYVYATFHEPLLEYWRYTCVVHGNLSVEQHNKLLEKFFVDRLEEAILNLEELQEFETLNIGEHDQQGKAKDYQHADIPRLHQFFTRVAARHNIPFQTIEQVVFKGHEEAIPDVKVYYKEYNKEREKKYKERTKKARESSKKGGGSSAS
jgi:hypothetical protein